MTDGARIVLGPGGVLSLGAVESGLARTSWGIQTWGDKQTILLNMSRIKIIIMIPGSLQHYHSTHLNVEALIRQVIMTLVYIPGVPKKSVLKLFR